MMSVTCRWRLEDVGVVVSRAVGVAFAVKLDTGGGEGH